MKKKKKKIVHIGMGKMLCGITDKHVAKAVWSNSSSTAEIDEVFLKSNERLCHKCKYIHKLNLRGS
ncbi:MAG TPA: hypothetical protein PLT92_13535 [Ignavibacteriaceae bacterium]|nr:hypothetical protein [Ignavibacteriaceae bacterium]